MRRVAAALTAGAALVGAAVIHAAPAAARAATRALVLTGDGFAAAGGTAKFGATSRARAIALARGVLGPPAGQGSHGDCGQGDIIAYARFRSQFELSFVAGRLSGWTADAAKPRTATGIGVGATLAALRRAYPDIETEPGDEAHGGLGPSFRREGGPNGWLDGIGLGTKVTGLYAGATCLAGI